jgi:hypothetical protein
VTSSALLVADADVDSAGRTRLRRDEYQGYIVTGPPDAVGAEKTAISAPAWAPPAFTNC